MSENKIISYSLWGTDCKYVVGAIENAKMAKRFYPGWKCRFYVDERIPVDKLEAEGAEIVRKPPCDTFLGLYWRFEIAGDESVDRFCVRDTDSRPNDRERWSVREWEQSDYAFHLMRDHKTFHNVPIMGGMWGAVRESLHPWFMEHMAYWLGTEISIRGKRGYWGSDQVFLKRYVWPRIRHNMLAHDDWQRSTRCDPPAPIPDRKFHVKLGRKMFVGQVYDAKNRPIFP